MVKRTSGNGESWQEEPRKFYDRMKIKSNSKEGQVSEMLTDMIEWAAKSTKPTYQRNPKNQYDFKN